MKSKKFYLVILLCILLIPIFILSLEKFLNFQNNNSKHQNSIFLSNTSPKVVYVDEKLTGEHLWEDETNTYYCDIPAGEINFLVEWDDAWDMDLELTLASDSSFSNVLTTSDKQSYQSPESIDYTFSSDQRVYIKVHCKSGSGYYEITISEKSDGGGGGSNGGDDDINGGDDITAVFFDETLESEHIGDQRSNMYYCDVSAGDFEILVEWDDFWEMDLRIILASDSDFNNILEISDAQSYQSPESIEYSVSSNQRIYIKVTSNSGSGYFDLTISSQSSQSSGINGNSILTFIIIGIIILIIVSSIVGFLVFRSNKTKGNLPRKDYAKGDSTPISSSSASTEYKLSDTSRFKRLLGMVNVDGKIDLEKATKYVKMPKEEIRGLIYELSGDNKISGHFEGEIFIIETGMEKFLEELDNSYTEWKRDESQSINKL